MNRAGRVDPLRHPGPLIAPASNVTICTAPPEVSEQGPCRVGVVAMS
jgi:hypothetical protein